MLPEKRYFEVLPGVVPADSEAEIRIRPRFEHRHFPEISRIRVVIHPLDGTMPDGSERCYAWDTFMTRFPGVTGTVVGWRLDEKGALVVAGRFAGEQEHDIEVVIADAENPQKTVSQHFFVYSVREDLFRLRPFKGDFHVHSTRSDGNECPAYIAARYREGGFDFLAVSDHHQYQPSLEAIAAWRDQPIDLKLFPGEEVHAPGNEVHIINFGASESINERIRREEAVYQREVAERVKRLQGVNPAQDAFPVAASEWVFDHIRAAGGLAVFCHPYWKVTAYVINEALITEIFNRRKFDAFELIGGYFKNQQEANNLQVVRYYQEAAAGNHFPVVGLSDSHGTDTGALFNWYYTVVLSPDDRLASLIGQIRNSYSVAIDAPEGEMPRVYGEFRLVKFVTFLLREYFPRHAELCELEGRLMVDWLGGDQEVLPVLAGLRGRTQAWRDAFYGGEAQS